jgi:hypothetical protein
MAECTSFVPVMPGTAQHQVPMIRCQWQRHYPAGRCLPRFRVVTGHWLTPEEDAIGDLDDNDDDIDETLPGDLWF